MHWMRQLATFFRNPATFSYRPALDWLLHLALRCFREEEAFDAIVEDKAAREEFRWQVRFAEVLLRGLIKEKAAEIVYYQVHPEEALPRAQRPDARPSDLKPRKRRPARLFPRLGPPRFHLRTPPLVESKPAGRTPPPQSGLRPDSSPSRGSTKRTPSPASEGGEKQGSEMTGNARSVLPREGEVASGGEPVGAPCRAPYAAPSAPASPLPLPGELSRSSLDPAAAAHSGMTENRPSPLVGEGGPQGRMRGVASTAQGTAHTPHPARTGVLATLSRKGRGFKRPTPNSPPGLMLRLIAVHNARKKLDKYAWRYAKAEARRKARWAAMGGKGPPPRPRRVAATIARITEPSSADPPAPAPWRAETAP